MNAAASQVDLGEIVRGAVCDVVVTRVKRGNATKLLVTNLVEDGIGVEASLLGGKRAERNDYVIVVGFVAEDGFLRVIVDGTRSDFSAAQSRANSGSRGLAGWWANHGADHIFAKVVKVTA